MVGRPGAVWFGVARVACGCDVASRYVVVDVPVRLPPPYLQLGGARIVLLVAAEVIGGRAGARVQS